MNKKNIITILFTLVAMAGLAQIHYRLEGTIGDSTLNTRLSSQPRNVGNEVGQRCHRHP